MVFVVGIFDRLFGRRRPRGVAVDIVGEREIRAKLGELSELRQNCEVLLGSLLCTSIFLEQEENHFFTDILMPSRGNDMLKEEEQVRINYQQRSVPYTMSCTYLGSTDRNGFAALKFGLPEIIRYSNRRDYYRVKPAMDEPVRIVINFGETGFFDGPARDISGGGIAVKSQVSGKVDLGRKIGTVEIMLPSGAWIICKGVVRRVSGSIIGIELEEIHGRDRREIVRYATERQKENIMLKTLWRL